jgi:DNA (cytosine-5)-methyltransferase 1
MGTESPLSALSLFAGAGGDTLGLRAAGFLVPWFVENWPPAIRSHETNFPDSKLLGTAAGGDLRKIPDNEFAALSGRVDLLFAGFPCQGFSHAGRKDPNDPRNRLFWEFVRVAKVVRPRWVVGENVSGLLHRTTDDGATPVSEVILRAFGEIGYRMAPPFVLDAADFGIPQRRRRVFFVGTCVGLPFRPPAAETRRSHAPVRPHVGFSLEGALPIEPSAVHGGIESWVEGTGTPSGAPHPYLVQKAQRGLMSYGRRISPHHVEVVDLDAPAKTIHSGYEFQPRLFPALKTEGGFFVRCFSPRELASLQGFPMNFTIAGTAKEKIVQVGNAVPPALAEVVARQVVRCDSQLAAPRVSRSDLRTWVANAPTPEGLASRLA